MNIRFKSFENGEENEIQFREPKYKNYTSPEINKLLPDATQLYCII